MKKLLFLLFFVFAAEGQPFKSSSELIIDLSTCFTDDCKATKFTASVATTKFKKLEITSVLKLSGDKGKLGGQALFYINDYVWIGGETVTDLNLNMAHEVMLGNKFEFGWLTIMPYAGMLVEDEQLGMVGIKTYISSYLSLGLQYNLNQNNHHLVVTAGTAIHEDLFESIQGLF